MDHIVSTADDAADTILRNFKSVLRPLARMCLLSTFFEDGIRMYQQSEAQASYMQSTWSCGWFFAYVFVYFNLFNQLIPAAIIMLQWNKISVRYANYMLGLIVLLQTCAYPALWSLAFFIRNISVFGAILLLLSEATESGKTMFAGVPSLEVNKTTDYLQFSGRILTVLMFLCLIKFDGYFRIILEGVCLVLTMMVVVGTRTKITALLLVIILFAENLYYNSYWLAYGHNYDFLKYDFYQTLSVIGGLLMVVALGPGGVSMDQAKKRF